MDAGVVSRSGECLQVSLDYRDQKVTDKIDLLDLVRTIQSEETTIGVKKSEYLDFVNGDEAFLVLDGEVVAFDRHDVKTGLSQTITLGKDDPIGFAEAIASRTPTLRYVANTEVKLLKIDAMALRKSVAEANILAATIIRYIVSRIFKETKRSKNYMFEDEFIDRNRDIFHRAKIASGDRVFSPQNQVPMMYFIRTGTVEISASDGIVLGTLKDGECFGEGALLRDRKRRFTATALSEVEAVVIEKSLVLKEIKKNSTLVQLAAVVLLRRLEIMNTFRLEKAREKML